MPFDRGGRNEPPRALYRPGRRDLLKLLGTAGAGGLAGCTGLSDGGGGGSSDGGSSGGENGTETADGGDGGESPSTPEDAGRGANGRYVEAVNTDAESLNWLLVADDMSGNYIGLALDGAWAIDDQQEVFPLWADVSTDDKRTYTVTLRENLMWGAGYGRMTAEDWVYMIRNVFQAEDNWTGYSYADEWFRDDEPIPVEKTGTRTFDIRLPEIDPVFPYRPVMWGQECLPKGLLEQYVPSEDADGLKQDEEINTLAYAGNLGPYSYERWTRDSTFVATRNEDYYLRDVESLPEAWHGAPYFERRAFRVIAEESTRLGALETGEVTAAAVPPNKAETFQRNRDVDVYVKPQPFAKPVLAYNQRANGWKPFRKAAVRRALAHAVDKRTIADGIERGFAEIAQTMQPSWSKWYDDAHVARYGVGDRYGPEITRSKLEAALAESEYGYDGDTLIDGDGRPVELTIYFNQGLKTQERIAEFVAQEFERNAGIAVTPTATASFIAKYAINAPPEGETVPWSVSQFNGGPRDVSVSDEAWDMSITLGFNTYPYTPTASKVFFGERATANYFGYVPERDIVGLYERASQTADEGVRKRLLAEAFGRINDEQPFGFLVMPSDIEGYRTDVVGPTENFASGWDAATWYFK